MNSILDRIAFYNPRHIRQSKNKRKRWRLKPDDILIPGKIQTPIKVFGYRKKLILNQTPAEKEFIRLLKILKADKLFHPQEVLFGFILDFYAPKLFLGIEIDGSSHNGKEEYDKKRSSILAANGIEIIRFTNNEVLTDQPFLINLLRKIIKVRKKLAKLRTTRKFCKVYLASDYSQDRLKALIPIS